MNKTRDRSAKPSFYQVILEGSHKVARGLMAGLMLGAGKENDVFFHYCEGVFYEPWTEKLAEMVRLHPQDCHLIVDGEAKKMLTSLASRIEQATGLRLTSSRYIRSATMSFSFEAFARRYGVEILGLLKGLPAGLRLVDFDHKETVHPHAAGVEAYAAAHDYTIKGAGQVTGRVDLLIKARRDLDGHPLIKVGRIKLNLA